MFEDWRGRLLIDLSNDPSVNFLARIALLVLRAQLIENHYYSLSIIIYSLYNDLQYATADNTHPTHLSFHHHTFTTHLLTINPPLGKSTQPPIEITYISNDKTIIYFYSNTLGSFSFWGSPIGWYWYWWPCEWNCCSVSCVWWRGGLTFHG